MKTALAVTGVWLICGVAVGALSAEQWKKSKTHFEGFGDAGPAAGYLQTVLLWPWALAVNLKGMRS